MEITLLPCTEPCPSKGDIRLRGESGDFEGLVEVCGSVGSDKLEWKTLCTTGWDENEAKVACTQLGFKDSNGQFETTLYCVI